MNPSSFEYMNRKHFSHLKPMAVTASLDDDVWVNLILPAAVNNVYVLQCLRAVNRKSLDAVDAKVSEMANVFQQHKSHMLPTPISVYVSADELSNSDNAKQAMSDWILLFCVANNRMRRKASPKAFIADMHNKLFMNHLTARLMGKLARSSNDPTDLKALIRKAHAHKWQMNKDKEQANVKVKEYVADDSYFYINQIDHERDIVEVLKMEKRGELKGLPNLESKTCAVQ